MTQKNDGGPAYPQLEAYGDMTLALVGMSLRDWFAGQALAGMNADSSATDNMSSEEISRSVYRMADAMIAERSKP